MQNTMVGGNDEQVKYMGLGEENEKKGSKRKK